MPIFWFLLSLVYLLTCLILAVYSLVGCCNSRLAATRSYASGNLLLVYILLLSAAGTGLVHGSLAFGALARHGWHDYTTGLDLRSTFGILVATLLPFSLCWTRWRCLPGTSLLIALAAFLAQADVFRCVAATV